MAWQQRGDRVGHDAGGWSVQQQERDERNRLLTKIKHPSQVEPTDRLLLKGNCLLLKGNCLLSVKTVHYLNKKIKDLPLDCLFELLHGCRNLIGPRSSKKKRKKKDGR